MSNFKKKEVMDYLTRKPVTSKDFQAAIDISKLRSQTPMPVTSDEERVLNREPFYQQPQQFIQDDIARPQIDNIPLYQGVEPNVAIQETMPTYVPPDMSPVMPQAPELPDSQYRQIELATGGRVKFADAGSATLPINPMLDNVNPNTLGGGAIIPAAGITAAAIADKFNISLEDAGKLLSRLYTGPEGLVIGGDRLTEEAKPKIETFPISEKQKTILTTETPNQINTNIGLVPQVTNTEVPGFESDKGIDTSVLYRKKPLDEETVKETYNKIKKETKRIPFTQEIANELDRDPSNIRNYLIKLKLPYQRSINENLNKYGDVTVPTFTESGIKWPSEEEEKFYVNQIKKRFTYPKISSEYMEKVKSGELLTNEQLAKRYGLSQGPIQNINKVIIEEFGLERPVIGMSGTQKRQQENRMKARKEHSDVYFETEKAGGTRKTPLGHASDVYNIDVRPETLVYTPVDINSLMGKKNKADYILRGIVEKQEDFIKNKPEDWKDKVEELNKIGMEYAAQTKGYKVFEPIDLKTLKRKPFLVDYSKTIDPTGIYEGKTIKEIAELTKDLKRKDFKTKEDYELYQKNREAVLKIQSKIKKSDIKKDLEEIEKIKKPDYATGGRVHLKNGTDDMYLQEIPSLGLTDPIEILEQQLVNEKDTQKILALSYILEETKKRKLQEEAKAAEYKKSQKEKGIRYMEDFPSQTDYFVETAKQLFTNPKYFYGKGLKGVTEGTEWLVGQPLQILFNQEGKNWEWYHPQAGEKLGINKFIEENIPKGATTGTLALGETAEIAGTFMDPFLAYGIVKGAMNTSKLKKPVQLEEKIDPTRRDLLKTGAVLTGGAIVYPTAKKLGLLETGVKAAKVGNAVRVATHQVVDNMPEFFPYLSELSLSKGKRIGEDYMRSGMTEFKREITIPLELNTIEKGKTNVKFEFIHDPAEGNVTAYYTNPLTDEKHSFEFYRGQQGRQKYGIDPEHPNAWEYYDVEVEPPGFHYKAPNKSDPYRKDYDYYDTATEGDDVIKALDKWYKGLSKEEKAKFEKKFITHSEYTDEIPAASYTEEENYPIMEFMYPKKKND